MTAVIRKPMAFYHQDGMIPAWRFAKRYAGPGGHIATLPEVIEARIATEPGELPWERYFTTNTAEYFGKGADGREKLIIAHGVGPMSTIEGIKDAYAWQYKDKERRRRGGRISAEEFLKLEAGRYGEVVKLTTLAEFLRYPYLSKEYLVMIVDFDSYIGWAGEWAFHSRHRPLTALADPLLKARLGVKAPQYINTHRKHAMAWRKENAATREDRAPYLIFNDGAANCPYVTFMGGDGKFNWSNPQPLPLEEGMAMGHLISVTQLMNTRSSDEYGPWESLTCTIACHEWPSGVRFLAVPDEANWAAGVDEAPSPHEVLRHRWRQLMRPMDGNTYVPPRLHLLEQSGNEWFTRYPKPANKVVMDDGDIEFHVRSVRPIEGVKTFRSDEDFFLRYSLSEVYAIAPLGANAYTITDISPKDHEHLTTVTVQFFEAEVDTSRRLPRVKEIKQDYDLLME